MGRLYRSHKYKLHKHFLKFKTKEEALRNKPEGGVTESAWEYLCDHFSDLAFNVCFQTLVIEFSYFEIMFLVVSIQTNNIV